MKLSLKQTDQWNPAIAVKPGGTELFIGYYSRQNDPSSNSLIMAYGAKGDVAKGLTNTTFDCFPISPTAFPPLFPGTTAATDMQFDPVFPQGSYNSGYLCWDAYDIAHCFYIANPNPPPPHICPCGGSYQSGNLHFFCDDNTWADADASYFYYAWCDRSRTWTNSISSTNKVYGLARPDADVKLAKIRQ